MRIATANAYDKTITQLTQRQSELANLQERISSGKRVQRPSDDPVSAVLSESARNRLARVEVDKRALEASRTSLTEAESAMGTAGDLIGQVRDLLVAAGNGTYGSREHKDLAQQIEGLRERLLAVANQTDSSGRTLFGGLGGLSQPFVEIHGPTGGGNVIFQGLRGQEATGNVRLPQSFDGEAIWMRVPQGNGTFVSTLPDSNTGSVRSSIGSVTDLSALTGHSYRIDFAEASGQMAYTVVDVTSGSAVPGQANVPYADGQTLQFDGMAMQLHGRPASGDRIDIEPATTPTDIFRVLQNAIDVLRGSSGQSAQLTQTVGRSLTELDAGHDRLLQARSQAGAWLNRADEIEGLLTDRAVAHQTEQSKLEDLDLIKGISDFQNQQTGLQAALQSYAQVQRLSLFQYIG